MDGPDLARFGHDIEGPEVATRGHGDALDELGIGEQDGRDDQRGRLLIVIHDERDLDQGRILLGGHVRDRSDRGHVVDDHDNPQVDGGAGHVVGGIPDAIADNGRTGMAHGRGVRPNAPRHLRHRAGRRRHVEPRQSQPVLRVPCGKENIRGSALRDSHRLKHKQSRVRGLPGWIVRGGAPGGGVPDRIVVRGIRNQLAILRSTLCGQRREIDEHRGGLLVEPIIVDEVPCVVGYRGIHRGQDLRTGPRHLPDPELGELAIKLSEDEV